MHWKLKAAIQNTVSFLPSSVSYATYYWVQRHFGGLRRLSPVERLVAGIDTWKRIQEQGVDPNIKCASKSGRDGHLLSPSRIAHGGPTHDHDRHQSLPED